METKRVKLGTICHNDYWHRNPAHRRVSLWLEENGEVTCCGAPLFIQADSVEEAHIKLVRAYGDEVWALALEGVTSAGCQD